MYKKIKIESSLNNLRIIENAVDEVTSEIGIARDNYGKILVSTLEAVNNAMLHGNKLNPDKFVQVEITFKEKNLSIKVTDEGPGFSPDKIPDPTIPENIEAVNGRGVFLISRLADKVIYRRNGSSVTMVFKDILV